MNDWSLFSTALPLLSATGMTLFLSLSSLTIGILLAFVFTILETSKINVVAKLTSILVMVIRGLPEILVVIAIYNGIPLILNLLADGFTVNLFIISFNVQVEINDFNVSPILCGIIALSLLYASYASQTLRGAFKAVSAGQIQAAKALGLSKQRTLVRIIVPQMWRHALPGLGNQWLVLLKDTALVSLITINDIMLQTKSIISQTHEPFTWYLIAAGIYLIISIISQKILQILEKKALYFENEVKHVG